MKNTPSSWGIFHFAPRPGLEPREGVGETGARHMRALRSPSAPLGARAVVEAQEPLGS
jgi:hypothetical protein